MSTDDATLLTTSKRQVINGSTAFACIRVRNVKEDILPNYIYWRLRTLNKPRMYCSRSRSLLWISSTYCEPSRNGKARGTNWMIKSYTKSLYSWCSKNTLHWQITCQGNLSETKSKINVPPTLSHNHLILSIASPFSSTNWLFTKLTQATAICISGVQIPSLSPT